MNNHPNISETFIDDLDIDDPFDIPFGDNDARIIIVANPQPFTSADKAEREQKRDVMEAETTHYFDCVDNFQSEITRINIEIKKATGENEKKKLRELLPPPMPPMLQNKTVGSGKSRLIQKVVKLAYERGLSTCVINPTHDLAENCKSDVFEKTGIELFHVFGRTDIKEAEKQPNLAKFICWKKDDAERAARQNHLPSQSICQKCPHWFSHVLKNVENEEKKIDAQNFFNKHKLDPRDFTDQPCQYLPIGMAKALSAEAVIMVQQSFSDAFGTHETFNDFGEYSKMQRLLIVDEKVPLSKEIEINLTSVSFWKKSLVDSVKFLKEKHVNSVLAEVLIKSNQSSDALDVETCFTNLINALNNKTQIDENEILRMYEIVKEAGGIVRHTASWEQTTLLDKTLNKTDQYFWIPLRALYNIATCIKNGTLRKTQTAIYAYEETPIIEWSLTRGNTIFLDATASIGMKALIKSVGGETYQDNFKQSLFITQFNGHLFARGQVKTKGYKDIAKNRMAQLESIAASIKSIDPNRPCAILTHKAWLKYSSDSYLSDDAANDMADVFFKKTGVWLGWFGKDDRGHNRWEGCNMAIVGMPILSPENIATGYACDRATLASHGITWPAWDGQMPELSESDWDDGKAPVPSQPEVLAWLLDNYSATIAQGIGRARAINSNVVLHVHLYGGLQTPAMEAALANHGVVINLKMQQTIHLTRKMYRARGTDTSAIINTAIKMDANGDRPSKRKVREQLNLNGDTASEAVIVDVLKKLREEGRITKPSAGGRQKKKVNV